MATHSALQTEIQRRGPWLQEEDKRLTMFVTRMGERKWDSIAKASGLERSGKSCRFRWLNYLRPNLKRDRINSKEEEIIMKLHKKWGNKWSRIARWLPGRTDNEIKNYWRSHLRKKFPIQLEDDKAKHGKQDKLSLKHDQNERDVPLYNHFELSNLEITNSPYEIRLSNWISNQLMNEKQEVNHHEECNSLELCFYYPNMNYAHRDDQTDYPNMNYAHRDDQTDHFWDSFTLWDIK